LTLVEDQQAAIRAQTQKTLTETKAIEKAADRSGELVAVCSLGGVGTGAGLGAALHWGIVGAVAGPAGALVGAAAGGGIAALVSAIAFLR
jgi:hypothetical protein